MALAINIPASLSANRWVGLVAASLGLFLGSLDITVNVALPEITRNFGIDVPTVQWIIIFYVGSTTGLQLSLGSAADIYGLKRFYSLGLIVYTLAVLLIGIVPLFQMVLGLRVLQAVGNGLILASAPALVTSIFPPEERGKALGIMTGLGALGMITGALGGGVLVDSFGWRAIFLARVPLGVLAVVFSLIALKEANSKGSRRQFDLRGAIAIFTGIVSLILFMTLGGRTSWTAPLVLFLFALFFLSLTTFIFFEKTSPRPVLDLAMLKHRVLSLAVVSSFLMFMATFVNLFILPFFVSDVLRVNAKALGFLLMLTPVISAASSPVGGWLSDRLSPAYLSTFALATVSASLFSFSTLDASSSIADVALRMGFVGLGFGVFQASNSNLIMGSVPSDRLGTGGAALSLSRSMGTVTSVALMSALFAARLESHTASLTFHGIAGNSQPFIMAFRDTYAISAILAATAAITSLLYWPRFIRSKYAVGR